MLTWFARLVESVDMELRKTLLFVGVLSLIAMPSGADRATFTSDIFPILRDKCQSCHHPGTIAPMSLLTYEQTRPWAKAISKQVESRAMPPFQAGGPLGYYKNDPRLSQEEIDTIVQWVAAGAPRGSGNVEIPAGSLEENEWPLGQPDLIVKFPAVNMDGRGVDEHINVFADHIFPDDVWIRAVQLKRSKGSLLHHATIFVTLPGERVPDHPTTDDELTAALGEKFNVMAHQPLYTWFPGLTEPPLSDGEGILLQKDTRLGMRLHFGPMEDRHSEELAVGLYMANGKIDTPRLTLGTLITKINLLPGASDYTLKAKKVFPVAGSVTRFHIHMHLRGKAAQVYFHYPDGTSELVFDLPRYSFDWQRYYFLSEPKHVPKGTVAEFVATWDNSDQNPYNPDPTQTVHWGKRTVDEMFNGTVQYTPDFKLPKTYIVKDGRVVSSYDNPGFHAPVVWGHVIESQDSDS